MKLFIILAVAVVAVAAAATIDYSKYIEDENLPETQILDKADIEKLNNEVSKRIIGGRPARRGQFPYQVKLKLAIIPDIFYASCGGSLITEDFVMTAAHCIYGKRYELLPNGNILLYNFEYQWTWYVDVYLGGNDLNQESEMQHIHVDPNPNYFMHEEYDPKIFLNDIALLRLPEKAILNEFVQVIKLPSASIGSLVGETVISSGWGVYNDASKESPNLLHYVRLQVMPFDKCKNFYPSVQDDKHICLDGAQRTSTCQGDSGGPSVIEEEDGFKVIGVTSFGSAIGCDKGFPSVVTRVSNYIDWINEKLNL